MSRKNKNDASEYSKDAFLTNPVASVQDRTGITQRLPYDADTAKDLADMLDVPVSAIDGSDEHSQAR